jgi:hypothetical protein
MLCSKHGCDGAQDRTCMTGRVFAAAKVYYFVSKKKRVESRGKADCGLSLKSWRRFPSNVPVAQVFPESADFDL